MLAASPVVISLTSFPFLISDNIIPSDLFFSYPKNSVELILKRGQISLHDVYMVHGSEENKSPNSRRAMTMRFMPTTSIFDHRFIFNTRDFSITKIYQARGKDVSMKNNIIPLNTK